MIYLKGIRLREKPPERSYLGQLPIIRHMAEFRELFFRKPVTFLVGENGSGKSTLLEAVAVAMGFNAEGGSRDFSFSTRDSHSELHKYITPLRSVFPDDGFFLRAESFYNTASFLDENSSLIRYGGRSFHRQSHGESFLALVANRFEGHGLYLLDEPESALSPHKLMTLLVAIADLVKKDSQFIIATHSPILMAYPNSQILLFDETGIHPTDYKNTEHYILTRRFLENPEHMLQYLLEES